MCEDEIQKLRKLERNKRGIILFSTFISVSVATLSSISFVYNMQVSIYICMGVFSYRISRKQLSCINMA